MGMSASVPDAECETTSLKKGMEGLGNNPIENYSKCVEWLEDMILGDVMIGGYDISRMQVGMCARVVVWLRIVWDSHGCGKEIMPGLIEVSFLCFSYIISSDPSLRLSFPCLFLSRKNLKGN